METALDQISLGENKEENKENKEEDRKEETKTELNVTPDKPMAQIVRIKAIEPVAKTENLLLASVLGWKCIINKNQNVL